MRNSEAMTAAIGFVCLLFLPCLGWAEEPKFELEPWEKRINQRQPPLPILDAIGLKPGMVVGEIGAGTGRMTMWLADRVGPEGQVYANDVNKDALGQLASRCENEGLGNVKTVLGEVEDPRLPAAALDMVFMINVYHHAENPVALVRNAIASLKPDGVLAIVECDPDKVDWGAEEGCTRKEDMIHELDQAGYEVLRIEGEGFLREDNIFLGRPKQEPHPTTPGPALAPGGHAPPAVPCA